MMTTTRTTTNDLLQNTDDDLTSASNAIDQMISMSIYDHTNPNNQNSDRLLLDQMNNTRTNSSPRFVFQIEQFEFLLVVNIVIRLNMIESSVYHTF